MDITFTLQSVTDGSFMTGQASNTTVYISKDGGSYATTTNAVAEIGRGSYKVTLTSAEATFSDVLLYQPVCSGAQTNTLAIDKPTDVSGLATSSALADVATTANGIKAKTDNLPEVPAAKSDIPSVQTIQSGLATSSELSTVASNVSAVKAKTDNLPTNPAAVTDVTTAKADIIAAMPDVSGLSTFDASEDVVNISISSANAIRDGLSTFDPETDAVTINSVQAATMVTADVSELATTADISDAVTDLKNYGQEHWQTANLSELATSSELANTQEDIISAMPDISGLPTAEDIWEYTDRTLTEEISVDISAQNIADITESVWEAPDRTLTDMKPKPNQKNIVCTPSNVINSYGILRLENWTNETAGTQAFDDKINTYITLAKEKMATDLNDQINAAIAYIGADNITELCAWLTGYNLYQDDESTDTDSLPETRYNQYLEQIHRIMENI